MSTRKHIAVIISEKDKGITDAWNKGIARANGDYIHILNADDYWPENKLEVSLHSLMENKEYGFVHGDVILVDEMGNNLIYIDGPKDYHNKLPFTMGRLNHPTLLATKECYTKVGLFDLTWKIGMDYDWLLRAHNLGIRGIYNQNVIAYMQIGGNSDRNWIKNYRDTRDISIHNGLLPWKAYIYYYLRIIKRCISIVLQLLLPKRFSLLLNKGRKVIQVKK